jgi:hypothetical protein
MVLRGRASFAGWMSPLVFLLLALALGCGGRTDDELDLAPSDANRDDGARRDDGSSPGSDASTLPGLNDARPNDAMAPSSRDADTPAMPARDAQVRPTLIGLTITPSEVTLLLGGSVSYQITATYSDRSQADVSDRARLETGDKTVASISGTSAKAVGAGKTKILATLDGQTTSAVITVQEGKETITSIEVTVGPTCVSGQSVQAHATALLSNGRRRDVTFSGAIWASDSPSAVVSAQGQVVCLGDGTAVIAATAEGVRGAAQLVSSGPAPSQLVIQGPPLLKPDEIGVYSLVAQFADGRSVMLSPPELIASDPSVLRFLKPGTAQAGSVGATVVTASLANGKLMATKKVTVSIASLISMAISPPTLELVAPSLGKLSVIGIYSDGSQFDMTDRAEWQTDTAGRVTVEQGTGVVHPNGIGTSTVTASWGGGQLPTTAKVTVTAGTPSSLVVREALSAPVGIVRPPRAFAIYADGSNLDATELVTWQVADPTIASVSGGMMLSGLKPGTTAYSASYGQLVSNSQQLVVTSAQLIGLRLAQTDLTVELTGAVPPVSYPLTVFGTFDDGTEEVVTESATYTVGNAQIVTVSNTPRTNGQLTGVAPGVTTVSVALGTKMVSTSVTVVAVTGADR